MHIGLKPTLALTLVHFDCSMQIDATLTGGGIVMESVGSTQVCVTLDSTPQTEANVTLETDDTPSGAQGKLLYLSACKKTSTDYISLSS